MSRRGPVVFSLVLCLWGCAAPRLAVQFTAMPRFAGHGPRVVVAPIPDPRPNPLQASVGYAGMFQIRQEWEVNEETPPSAVVQSALTGDLAQRGMTPGPGGYEVLCQMPEFVLRYRNYAGMMSATDGWGYLDLICRVTASGQEVWQGPLYARAHRVFYFSNGISRSALEDDLWPELMGALVQQLAAILNRAVFHQPASAATIQEAQRLLRSSDDDDRYEGAYLLGVTGDPSVVPMLAQALGDPEAKVRRSVVDGLGTMGAAGAMGVLLSNFDQEDGNTQWAILKAILQTGDPAAFQWLRRKLPDLDSDTLREIAEDVLRHPAPSPAPPAASPGPPPPPPPAAAVH